MWLYDVIYELSKGDNEYSLFISTLAADVDRPKITLSLQQQVKNIRCNGDKHLRFNCFYITISYCIHLIISQQHIKDRGLQDKEMRRVGSYA